jgi:hypothetical protein
MAAGTWDLEISSRASLSALHQPAHTIIVLISPSC